jgi:hypothetical protein
VHATTQAEGPQLTQAKEDKIVYIITFNLQDDGIILGYNDTTKLPVAAIEDVATATN